MTKSPADNDNPKDISRVEIEAYVLWYANHPAHVEGLRQFRRRNDPGVTAAQKDDDKE